MEKRNDLIIMMLWLDIFVLGAPAGPVGSVILSAATNGLNRRKSGGFLMGLIARLSPLHWCGY